MPLSRAEKNFALETYFPRSTPSASNRPTLTCVMPRSSTMRLASAAVRTFSGFKGIFYSPVRRERHFAPAPRAVSNQARSGQARDNLPGQQTEETPYISVWPPSSMTRLLGIWKNSVALMALLDRNTKSFLRQTAILPLSEATIFSRPTKTEVSISLNRSEERRVGKECRY